MFKSIDKFKLNRNLVYGSDQTFLTDIYSNFKNSRIIHDEFFGGLTFPIKRLKYSFIGERINEYDVPSSNDREVLVRYYERKYKYLKIYNYSHLVQALYGKGLSMFLDITMLLYIGGVMILYQVIGTYILKLS